MSDPIGERVKQRIEALTPTVLHSQVADRIGMSKDTFSRSVNGGRRFTAIELSKVAEALGTSIHWLVTGTRDPLEPKVSARHEFDQAARSYSGHDWTLAMEVTNGASLAYKQVKVDPAPNFSADPSVSEVVLAAEAHHRLLAVAGPNFIDDFSGAIEMAFGIDVFVIPHTKSFGAYAMEVTGNPFIVVRESGEWYRTNWALAHELGHVLRGDLAYLDESQNATDNERIANRFAANLLLPEGDVKNVVWASATAQDAAEFVWNHGVSTMALQYRLNNLGIESQSVVDALSLSTVRLVEAHIQDFSSHKRSSIFRRPRFPARVVKAHMVAFERGDVNGKVLAWMLGVSFDDLVEQHEGVDEVALGAIDHPMANF